jgi:hypothetical protein
MFGFYHLVFKHILNIGYQAFTAVAAQVIVSWVLSNVSEEHIASTFRVTELRSG